METILSGNPDQLYLFHRTMIQDSVRMKKYREAIVSRVKKGDVVLDLGAGTGILSHFALQAGASRVYAIEKDPSMVALAQMISRTNRTCSHMRFLSESSLVARLPEKVDLIITETMGNIGLDEGILPSLIDARKRFLKPRGLIVPGKLAIYGALVRFAEGHKAVEFWNGDLFGVDFSGLKPFVLKSRQNARFTPRNLLSREQPFLEVDFNTVSSCSVKGTVVLKANQGGTVHGLGTWFKAALTDSAGISNSPLTKRNHWKQCFLPATEPFTVKAGDRVEATISSANGALWNWELKKLPRSG